MPEQVYTKIYDQDYFCLTDENILLCKRNGNIIQIKPCEFQEGDLLWAQDERGKLQWSYAQRTVRVVPAKENLVQLETQRGIFRLTTGHKMFLDNGLLEAAGNLKVGDRLKYASHIDLPTDKSIGISLAYVLGAYAAEGSHQEGVGSCGTGRWRLEWALNFTEVEFATKISFAIQSAFPSARPIIKDFPEYSRKVVGVYQKDIVLNFKEIGSLGYCFEKRIPSCIFSATEKEKFAFLAAIFDGDGTIQENNSLRLKMTSHALVEGVHILLTSLGIRSTVTFQKEDPQKENKKETYAVVIYGKENIKVFLDNTRSYLGNGCRLWAIYDYCCSDHGNIKYTRDQIKYALEQFGPTNCTDFSNKSGINQRAIRRIFGTWNKCLKYYGYSINNSRWGLDHEGCLEDQILTGGIDQHSNFINKVTIYEVDEDTLVYDFCIPEHSNFLLGTMISHNSGSSMFLYIGDVWVDEITSLQYTTYQTKVPLYGYASQLFTDTAAGHVIVEGSFTINYKEQGYLWAVLRRYFEITEDLAKIVSTSKNAAKNKARRDQALMTKTGESTSNKPLIGSNGTRIQRASIERLVQGDATRSERYKFYQELAGYATFNVNSPKDKIFEDIAEVFEDQVWTINSNETLNSQIRKTDDNAFDGFDMYVVFGDYSSPGANHSTQKICSVRLLGQSKTINLDSFPTQESYNFLARSVV